MSGNDDYNLSSMQQHIEMAEKKEKGSEKESQIDKEIEEKVKRLEEENANIVKDLRTSAQQSTSTQRQTTEELLAQGEQIDAISRNVSEVKSNAEKGERIAEEMKRDSEVLSTHGIFGAFKGFFGIEGNEKSASNDEIKNEPKEGASKNNESRDKHKLEDLKFKSDADDPEENMKLLLGDLKRMNREQSMQRDEIKKQRLKISNIREEAKKGKRILKETNKKLEEL